MNSANDAQKIEDPEKQVLHAPSISTDSSLHLDISDLKTEGEVDAKSKKMVKVQHLCFSLILLALLGLTLVSCSSPPRHGSPMSPEERLQFQALLNTIEPASLHDVLHKHLKEKYKHGVYQEDKAAMEVVAQSNVEVAHSLIEVAKRQASNTSTVIAVVTTTTAVTTDVPPVTTTPVVVPPTTTPVTTNNPPTTSPTTQATTTPTQQTLPSGTTTTPTTVQIPATTPASSKPGSTTSPTKTGTSNGTLRGRQIYPFAPSPVVSSAALSKSTCLSAYYPAGNSSSVLSTAGPSVYSPYAFVEPNATAVPSNATNSSIPLTTAAPLHPPAPQPILSQNINNISSSVAPHVPVYIASNSSNITTAAEPVLSPSLFNSSNLSSTALPSSAAPYTFPNTSSTYCPTATPSFLNITANSTSLDSSSSTCTSLSFFNSTSGPSPTTSSGTQGQTSPLSRSSSGPDVSNSAIVQSSSPPDTLRTEASSARSVTQQTVFTTTLPNGAVSTVTSVTVVPAGQAEKTGSATKTNGNASLQTNAANSKGLGLGGVIGMLGMVAVGAL